MSVRLADGGGDVRAGLLEAAHQFRTRGIDSPALAGRLCRFVPPATRRLAVSKLVTLSFAALAALAMVVSPTTAAPAAAPMSALTVGVASDLGPSRGGPSKVPHAWIPLHAREFALAKAAANVRAG